MASITRSRINVINRLRCSIFQTSYNPTSVRTGAKYLRARLRGPSMVKYYPEVPSIAQLIREFPEIGWENHAEQVRLQDIADHKARGKGAPKKAKSKGLCLHYHTHDSDTDRCLSFQRRVGGRTGNVKLHRKTSRDPNSICPTSALTIPFSYASTSFLQTSRVVDPF